MIDCFFRSFYGGVFLERELQTSSRMFAFTFKMFAEGSATLPARGMGEIPRQLAERLPSGSVQLATEVRAVDGGGVTLTDGRRVEARRVVLATDGGQVARLLPGAGLREPKWRSVTNVYFAAQSSPVKEAIICLNGEGCGRVNNVCVLTDASECYSTDGRALVSVSVLGLPEVDGLAGEIQQELRSWFGPEVADWEHLRTYRIREALPEQPLEMSQPTGWREHGGVFICGDYCLSASIEGAVISGKRLAEALAREFLEVV
jgi:hypothetical protein